MSKPFGYDEPFWQRIRERAIATDHDHPEYVWPDRIKLDADLRQDYVYFIGSTSGPVKIGYSCDPQSRLADLQTAHWDKLEIIVAVKGGPQLERHYHAMLVEHRMLGEWFARHPDVLDLISTLSNTPKSPT